MWSGAKSESGHSDAREDDHRAINKTRSSTTGHLTPSVPLFELGYGHKFRSRDIANKQDMSCHFEHIKRYCYNSVIVHDDTSRIQ